MRRAWQAGRTLAPRSPREGARASVPGRPPSAACPGAPCGGVLRDQPHGTRPAPLPEHRVPGVASLLPSGQPGRCAAGNAGSGAVDRGWRPDRPSPSLWASLRCLISQFFPPKSGACQARSCPVSFVCGCCGDCHANEDTEFSAEGRSNGPSSCRFVSGGRRLL